MHNIISHHHDMMIMMMVIIISSSSSAASMENIKTTTQPQYYYEWMTALTDCVCERERITVHDEWISRSISSWRKKKTTVSRTTIHKTLSERRPRRRPGPTYIFGGLFTRRATSPPHHSPASRLVSHLISDDFGNHQQPQRKWLIETYMYVHFAQDYAGQ